jgi:hypothetical protein
MAYASCAPYEIDDQHNQENDHQRSDTDVHETSLSSSLPSRQARVRNNAEREDVGDALQELEELCSSV